VKIPVKETTRKKHDPARRCRSTSGLTRASTTKNGKMESV
jgi:hypothetical protein